MDNFTKALLIIVLIPFSLALKAWVLAILWTWFVVPLGVPAIGNAHALGLAGLIWFSMYSGNNRKLEDYDVGEAVVSSILAPLIALLVGWCCYTVMT